MRRCSVKPYEGNKQYIFVSYCHKDKKYAFPIIERLAYDGYRVWYDEGIDPGSEWPEIIAGHLNGCSACIALISENSLNSHNCRREINFALLKKRPFISVVLEPVDMSLGMEMQLSATQSIFKYTLSSEDEFYGKLYEARFLSESFGTPDPAVYISKPEDYGNDFLDSLFGSVNRVSFSDKWFTNIGHDPADDPGMVSGSSTGLTKQSKENEADNSVNKKPEPDSQPGGMTRTTKKAWIVRVKTDEIISLKQDRIKLGRSETMADYQLLGNSSIGRVHAMVLNRDEKYYIVDNNSKNGTFLNSKKLDPDSEYELADGDSIRLANEMFVFYQTGGQVE